MSTMIRPLFALAFALALAGCNKSEHPAKPAAPTTSPAAPTATAPAASAPATTAAASSGGIGVAECDDYLTRYEACVSSKVPAEARAALEQSLTQMRDAWRAAAATDAGKQGLAAACKQAHEAARSAMQQYGCSDF